MVYKEVVPFKCCCSKYLCVGVWSIILHCCGPARDSLYRLVYCKVAVSEKVVPFGCELEVATCKCVGAHYVRVVNVV